jgi:glycerophosphoryl diester phosphodiesterase
MTAVFAHRGFTQGITENTLEAFAEARARGADGVELDVRRSRDGALVVHHDAEIEGVGTISELAVHDLPEYVPLLGEALETCDGMRVNVEIKNLPGEPGFEADHAIARAVVDTLHDCELAERERVVVSSFNRDTVEAVLAADSNLATGWLLPGMADPLAVLDEAVERGFTALHPFVLGVTGELVERAHAAGLAVNTWTVNDPAHMRAMCELGVDVIITDHLEEALEVAQAAEQAEQADPGADPGAKRATGHA